MAGGDARFYFRSELAAEGAPGGGRFVNDDLAEAGEIFFEFSPEPGGHDLDGRAFETFDIVEVAVIHLFKKGAHGIGNTLVVVNPADLGIHLALDVNLNLEAVTVHLTAFVVVGKAGKGVGRFEAEVLDDSGTHGSLSWPRG